MKPHSMDPANSKMLYEVDRTKTQEASVNLHFLAGPSILTGLSSLNMTVSKVPKILIQQYFYKS